jgi:2-C-methyl-D-erythritol 4-phosphate cytidylyltransferase
MKKYVIIVAGGISVLEASRRCQTMVVDGSPENIKITTPVDLVIADALLTVR